jgi:hypothetical protein
VLDLRIDLMRAKQVRDLFRRLAAEAEAALGKAAEAQPEEEMQA